MSSLPQDERDRRSLIVESVKGSHAMEGIFADNATQQLLDRYTAGELTLDELSCALDAHAAELLAATRPMAGVA